MAFELAPEAGFIDQEIMFFLMYLFWQSTLNGVMNGRYTDL